MSLNAILSFGHFLRLPTIKEIVFTRNGIDVERLDEGKWIRGRFDRNIRIDQPTHGTGQRHGHVLGRKGNEFVVVNVDGTASHGKKGRLHTKDADALRANGFNIPTSNIIEWTVLGDAPELVLG